MKTKRVFSVVCIMLALLIVGMIWMGGGRETLNVDRPLYKECSSKSLEILRVECNDTATIVYFEVSGNSQEWVRCSSGSQLLADDGGEYKLLRADGIELDKECYIFKDGKARFALMFEPLPEQVKSFHFLEGTGKGAWKVMDILLTDELPEGFFRYTLKGTLSNSAFDGHRYPIIRYSNRNVSIVGRITVKGNQFEFQGVADSAMYCRIDVGADFGNFIVEEGVVNVDMKTHMYPSGTPQNDAYAEFARLEKQVATTIDSIRQSIIQGDMDRETRIKRLNELEYDFDIRRDIQKEIIKPFILKHANDEVGAAALQDYLALGTPEMLDDIYPHLGPWILSKNKEQIATINASRKMAPGQPFIDFEGEDVNGNKVKLSDYVGKGKYVIVDFSASWCGPCKAEMPNLARVYDTYKGEKFDMVTVMVWDKLEASKKMLDEFHVKWKSILNVGMKPMELYGFSGIPRIMLFAPDGTIVHNELRGDLIENKVKEVLGK